MACRAALQRAERLMYFRLRDSSFDGPGDGIALSNWSKASDALATSLQSQTTLTSESSCAVLLYVSDLEEQPVIGIRKAAREACFTMAA